MFTQPKGVKMMHAIRHNPARRAYSALRKTAFAFPLCLLAFVPYAAKAAAPDCSALSSSPIFQVVNPASQTNLLTPWQSEASSAASTYGFTQSNGTPFYASLAAATGLVAVHRLYNASSKDFIWVDNPNEITSAVQTYGYVDQGINFYVSSSASSCTQPVYRFVKGAVHRYAVGQADQDALTAAGWKAEGTMFYAGIGDQVFSIAIMPDTQNETTYNLSYDAFSGRAQWLADNKDALNLRYVLHSGDVSNWGENDPGDAQYTLVSNSMQSIEAVDIPYVLSVGNHDVQTMTACNADVKGVTCPQTSGADFRKSPVFNQFFAGRFGNPASPYPEKQYVTYCTPTTGYTGLVSDPLCNISNGYTLFEAGGLNWMVLSLELWPRTEVVQWAKSVVASHPNYNVIVVTHSYLDENGNIVQVLNDGLAPYDADETTPQSLFNQLISQYPNIRFVFSGHVGNAASRVDQGASGNQIAAYLECFHLSATNPVRILQIDAVNNTATSYVYEPKTNQYWNGNNATWINATPTTAGVQNVVTGMNYIH